MLVRLLGPQVRVLWEWKERTHSACGTLECSRGHLEPKALVLTEVSVSRDPKMQVMTTMSTNHSLRLAQM